MILRPAAAADAASLAAIDLAAKHAAMPAIAWRRSLAEVTWYLGERLIPAGGVVVAEADGRTAGYMACGEGWVHQLYLAPAFWRRGIGSALIAHAKRRHPEGLRLYCFQANTAGRAFYERHGFGIVAAGDGRDNEEGAPDLLYAWQGPGDPPGEAPPGAA